MVGIFSWLNAITVSIDDLSNDFFADGTPKFTVGGAKFMTHMFACYLGVHGFGYFAMYLGAPAMLQKMGVPSEVGQQIMSAIILPWSLKPLYAVVSDGLPLFHYKKLPYMLAVTIIGLLSNIALGFLPYSVLSGNNATVAFGFMFGFMVMVSCDDSLTQGKYTQVAKAKGSSIIVLKTGLLTFAGVVVSMYAGYLNDTGVNGPQWLILTALPAVVFGLTSIALNFMGDERFEESCSPDRKLLTQNSRLFALALGLGATTIYNVSLTFLGASLLFQVASTVALVFGLLVFAFYAMEARIAKINVYLFLCRICTFVLIFPLQQYYTTNPIDCPRQPEGELMNLPNFPFIIFNTIGGLCTNGATLGALYIFEKYVCHWKARPAFWITTAFQVVAGTFDMLNTTRWNQKLMSWSGLGGVTWDLSSFDDAGLPITRTLRLDDLSTYVIGTALLEPLIKELDGLPSTLLLSKLCPKGVETTMFAILVGFFNLGYSLSGQTAALAVDAFGFDFGNNPAYNESRVGEPGYSEPKLLCSMGGGLEPGQVEGVNGMFYVLLIGNILLPFATIPLTFIFIPDIRLDEDFLDTAEASVEMAEGARELTGAGSALSVDGQARAEASAYASILAKDLRSTGSRLL